MSAKIENMMKARFWELDDKIKEVWKQLHPLEAERNALAPQEAVLREKKKRIKIRKQKIIADTGLDEMCKERSGCAGFLKGKTGVHP